MQNCQICYDQYDKINKCPISLNCGHTFCSACLRQMPHPIVCGFCRKKTHTYINNLGKNITIIELLEKLEEQPLVREENVWQGPDMLVNREHLANFYDEIKLIEKMAMRKGLGEINNKTTALLHNVFVAENQLRCTSNFFHDLQNQLTNLHAELISSQQAQRQSLCNGNTNDHYVNSYAASTSSNGASTSSNHPSTAFANGGFGNAGRRRTQPPVVVLDDLPIEPRASETDQSTWARTARSDNGW